MEYRLSNVLWWGIKPSNSFSEARNYARSAVASWTQRSFLGRTLLKILLHMHTDGFQPSFFYKSKLRLKIMFFKIQKGAPGILSGLHNFLGDIRVKPFSQVPCKDKAWYYSIYYYIKIVSSFVLYHFKNIPLVHIVRWRFRLYLSQKNSD